MIPVEFLHGIVNPTLRLMSNLAAINIPSSNEARVLLMVISGQEANWTARLQWPFPHARGRWQFEGLLGGTGEVLGKLPRQVEAICSHLEIPFDGAAIFEAIAWNDTLACAMARLLLWQDPAPLPAIGDVWGAYLYYDNNWRPGAKRPDDWPGNYEKSVAAVNSP